jgi:hypothetical protein
VKCAKRGCYRRPCRSSWALGAKARLLVGWLSPAPCPADQIPTDEDGFRWIARQ